MGFALKEGKLMLKFIKSWFLEENIVDMWLMFFVDIPHEWKCKNYFTVSILAICQIVTVPAVIISICISTYLFVIGLISALLLQIKELLGLK